MYSPECFRVSSGIVSTAVKTLLMTRVSVKIIIIGREMTEMYLL